MAEKTIEQYRQILLTYTRPLGNRVFAGALALFLICVVCTLDERGGYGGYSYRGRMIVLPLVAILAGWAAGMVSEHVKEQVADPRSALLPGFRPPHLAVGAILPVAIPAPPCPSRPRP